LTYREPYTEGPPEEDVLVAGASERRPEIGQLFEELDLGYKLHALALNRA
jgi:hypothetical protein